MRIRAFFIITALFAFPLQASNASTAAFPPLPPPRPAEAPFHPAPNDLAPAEQTKRAPTIDQACLDRLSAAGIEFEQVTLPPAVNPECAIATPVRLKAVKLPPRWRTSIRLPEEPTLSCQFGERFGQPGRKKGSPKTGGRVRGVPNKVTVDLRGAILHAFDTVGGEAYLVKIAKTLQL